VFHKAQAQTKPENAVCPWLRLGIEKPSQQSRGSLLAEELIWQLWICSWALGQAQDEGIFWKNQKLKQPSSLRTNSLQQSERNAAKIDQSVISKRELLQKIRPNRRTPRKFETGLNIGAGLVRVWCGLCGSFLAYFTRFLKKLVRVWCGFGAGPDFDNFRCSFYK
jgi:hypothetical protein